MTAVKSLALRQIAQDDMRRLAAAVGRCLRGGDVVSLEGELGSGKTFFVRQLAATFGYAHPVTSPTFVLQKLYDLPQNSLGIEQFVHYDVYRLDTYAELLDLGFDDLAPTAVAFVEWGDRFAESLPSECWRMHFSTVDDTHRDVRILAPSEKIAALAAELLRENLDVAIIDE
jgi:tRNA threonylcarbamoyladenosine biosynthesis protein TsaE